MFENGNALTDSALHPVAAGRSYDSLDAAIPSMTLTANSRRGPALSSRGRSELHRAEIGRQGIDVSDTACDPHVPMRDVQVGQLLEVVKAGDARAGRAALRYYVRCPCLLELLDDQRCGAGLLARIKPVDDRLPRMRSVRDVMCAARAVERIIGAVTVSYTN